MTTHKLQYIEGLRGLAAVQVVLLHYFSAFLPFFAHFPGPVHFAWETTLRHTPLWFLLDGYSAVCLFFILSGFVLAPSFLKSEKPLPLLATKRYLRLFVPIFSAFVVALTLYFLMPHAASDAATLSQSGWLVPPNNSLTIMSLIQDALLNSTLTGYSGSSLLDYLPNSPNFPVSAELSQALNPPTWTMHVEFWGSMLVLALAVLRRYVGGVKFSAIFVLVAFMIGTSYYSLFLFGFLLFQIRGNLLGPRHVIFALFGVALVLSGLYICINKNISAVGLVLTGLRHITLLSAKQGHLWQSQVGAMLIFGGVMLNVQLRSFLAVRVIQWLGKVSFSVYLLHVPILLTFSSLVFTIFAQRSYALACIAAFVIGIGVTYAAAAIFEKNVDRRAVHFSKRIIGD